MYWYSNDLLYVFTKGRFWHMKNKSLQQLHASSQNLEAIDIWKVACHPPSRCSGVQWLFLLEHHNFLSFKMRRANYNYIEIKTGLKGILERVSPRKNMSNASQNLFYIFITMSPSFRWSKASLEWFSLVKYCLQCSNFYWIKSIWLETVQIKFCIIFVALLN